MSKWNYGWWVLGLLVLIVVLMGVLFVVDVYSHWWHISSMSVSERAHFYGHRLRFYHVRPLESTDSINSAADRFTHGRELSAAIDRSLRRDKRFCYYFRGYMIQNSLPDKLSSLPDKLPSLPDKLPPNNLVVVHIHGTCGGLWPDSPWINRLLLGTHALPIVDTVNRFIPLRLPVTIIGFVMPTEGLATLNFGQNDDSLAIGVALQAIIQRLKGEVKIVLTGDCLGALRIERWLHSRFCTPTIQDRIHAVVLGSPIANIRRIVRHPFLQKYVCPTLMPNIIYHQDASHAPALKQFAGGASVLISLLEGDCLCDKDEVPDLKRRFPGAEIVVVPKSGVNHDGRPIEHGTTFGWPPLRSHLAKILHVDKLPLVSSEPQVTIVTALYDIQREHYDGRRFESYKQWFSQTLLLPAPMVVFVDESLREWVLACRPKERYLTLVISENKTQCSQFHNLTRFQDILQSDRFQCNRQDLSMRMPEYLMIIYSKFGWLQQSIKINPFGTNVFIWVDAGQSRFWSRSYWSSKDCHYYWPHPSWTRNIATSNRVWLQGRRELFPYASASQTRLQMRENVIGTCESVLWATVMAANKATMLQLCDLVHDYLEHELLAKGRVDTEQVALQMLWSKHPELFQFLIPIRWRNLLGTDQYPELVPIWAQPLYHLTDTHFLPRQDQTPATQHNQSEIK